MRCGNASGNSTRNGHAKNGSNMASTRTAKRIFAAHHQSVHERSATALKSSLSLPNRKRGSQQHGHVRHGLSMKIRRRLIDKICMVSV